MWTRKTCCVHCRWVYLWWDNNPWATAVDDRAANAYIAARPTGPLPEDIDAPPTGIKPRPQRRPA